MQAKIDSLEKQRTDDELYRKEMEKMIQNLEKSKVSQISETNMLENQNVTLKLDLDKCLDAKSKL